TVTTPAVITSFAFMAYPRADLSSTPDGAPSARQPCIQKARCCHEYRLSDRLDHAAQRPADALAIRPHLAGSPNGRAHARASLDRLLYRSRSVHSLSRACASSRLRCMTS